VLWQTCAPRIVRVKHLCGHAARAREAGDPRLLLTFPVPVPASFHGSRRCAGLLGSRAIRGSFGEATARGTVAAAGRPQASRASPVVQPQETRQEGCGAREALDSRSGAGRFRAGGAERGRVLRVTRSALRVGQGRVNVQVVDDSDLPVRCRPGGIPASCTAPMRSVVSRAESQPVLVHSPVGACASCRGFGRTIGIDYGWSFRMKASRCARRDSSPGRRKSYKECQDDLLKYARSAAFRWTRRAGTWR